MIDARSIALAIAAVLTSCSASPPVKQLGWGEIAARPIAPASIKTFYGRDPQQFGELRLPEGAGPFPVVMLLHGGCWLAEYDYKYMGHLAEAFKRMGVATWNVEYRRIGNGGGWPATFRDAAAAADKLAALGKEYPLDLSRAITLGHSAGGQLALWVAGRAGA
ncbi:MAG TPA: alpha/beta hydrolase, partial [Verrucomicrobiae bacterium]|nr:alpha/beta hydrolase [Verrucomicrobiae bacterium]